MPAFQSLTAWLVAHGYAVLLPQRPGHGETGGRYLEDQGPCQRAQYVKSGEATADSIAAVINFMVEQPFIKPNGVLVVGNSAGGWGALALAGRNPPNVSAIVNISGGRGGRNLGRANSNCSPGRLVAAAGKFGRTARIPTLWLYAENDSYFPPDLSRKMEAAYTAAGGKVEYVLLSPRTVEGHSLIDVSPPSWIAPLERFLARFS
jgi:dienelactone hydrolase